MKSFLIIILGIFSSLWTMAQPVFQKERTIPGQYTALAVDNLEQIYLLTTTNQLKKLNEKGDSLAVYNNIRKFGAASLLDISNPLRVLLFYKNFGTLVVLDRMLNPINTIDLRQHQIFNAEAVGLSYDGKIWVFDNTEKVLKKIDENGKLLLKTPDFRQLFNGAPNPNQIIDRNQLVYVYDSTCCIYSFDYYGSYKGKIPIAHWNNLRISDKYIFGNDSSQFYRYHLITQKLESWTLPAEIKASNKYLLGNHFLYVIHPEGLTLYRYQF